MINWPVSEGEDFSNTKLDGRAIATGATLSIRYKHPIFDVFVRDTVTVVDDLGCVSR
jgi:hypothetical protein